MNIFVTHITNKGLISFTFKVFLQIKEEKTSNLIEKWIKDRDRQFMEKGMKMTNKHR